MARTRKQLIWVTLATLGALPVSRAHAQAVPPATQTEPAAPPAETVPADETPAPAQSAPEGAGGDPTVFPPPRPHPAQPKRLKQLRITNGVMPTQTDFGGEADLVSTVGVETPPAPSKKWAYSLKGYLRAPMRIGIGDRNDGQPGSEWHSPPRMPGFFSHDWAYIGVAPPPTAALYLNIQNNRVSGTVIMQTDTYSDAGYDNLKNIGGISQAYITLKFPDLFGTRGGLAWTVGAAAVAYGAAGPYQQSTGYYQTPLFGRLHVAGSILSANVDLTDDVELVVEHGIGAKLEVMPWISGSASPPRPEAPWLPQQGPVPQGSTYVQHMHAGLIVNDTLRIAAHYLNQWTPDDMQPVPNETGPKTPGRMQVLGGEVHVDSPRFGNGYLGYSYVDANKILALSDGFEVLYGGTGYQFKSIYFDKTPLSSAPSARGLPHNDTGTVSSVLGQYLVRLSGLMGRKEPGPDAALVVYGMLNRVKYTNIDETGIPKDLESDKVKVGAELAVSPISILSLGARFDRVNPDGGRSEIAYTAISPRVILHTNWFAREYVMLSYTRFSYGRLVYGSPTWVNGSPKLKPDPNLVSLTAMVSF